MQCKAKKMKIELNPEAAIVIVFALLVVMAIAVYALSVSC